MLISLPPAVLTPVLAHSGQPIAPHDVWAAWSPDPLVLAVAVGAAYLYARGRDLALRPRPGAAHFWAGLAVVMVALLSPLEVMAGSLASAHMVQHMLLVVVAAPLLVWSRPLPIMLRAWPRPVRKSTGNWRRRLRLTPRRLESLTHPILAWLALAASLWVWHSAYLYGLAVRMEPVHALEHIMFLGAAVWFWNSVLRGAWIPRHSMGPGILLLFTMGIQGVLLSALLTFAERPWYDEYLESALLWGFTPLQDQHLAGVIMWVPGGLVYTGAALVILFRWIGATGAELEAPSTET